MATYQGERFVALQLRSILEQLDPGDEVIIVDDASTDATCCEILNLQETRVTLLRNTGNKGVLRSFERALTAATGEVIFLSDQDDLWSPNKVETMVALFTQDQALMLLASDAILIDEDGGTIGHSFYAERGKFTAGLLSNLLIGKFHGCTMALRSSLLNFALPFPPGTLIHHDTWIGCINSIVGGKAKYVPEALVAYRRHSTNVTGRTRLSSYVRFQMRALMIFYLMAFCLKRWSV
jgi:glycosyltransferase involved in cell wall biosynthesis